MCLYVHVYLYFTENEMEEGLPLFSGQNFEGYFKITVSYVQKLQCMLDCEWGGLEGLLGGGRKEVKNT